MNKEEFFNKVREELEGAEGLDHVISRYEELYEFLDKNVDPKDIAMRILKEKVKETEEVKKVYVHQTSDSSEGFGRNLADFIKETVNLSINKVQTELNSSWRFGNPIKTVLGSFTEEIDNINIDVINKAIYVEMDEKATEAKVILITTTSENNDYDVNLDVNDGTTLFVKEKAKEGVQTENIFFASKIIVTLPRKKYMNFTLKSLNGGIIIEGDETIFLDELLVNSVNGKVYLCDIDSNLVKASTINGKICLEEVITDTIDLDTVNGRIEYTATDNIRNAEVSTNTVHGRIEINGEDFRGGKMVTKSICFTEGKKDINLKCATVNGRIEVNIESAKGE